jgi:hypothetical protein
MVDGSDQRKLTEVIDESDRQTSIPLQCMFFWEERTKGLIVPNLGPTSNAVCWMKRYNTQTTVTVVVIMAMMVTTRTVVQQTQRGQLVAISPMAALLAHLFLVLV